MTDAGPVVLALDELLTGNHAEDFAKWVKSQPEDWHTDQISAAARDTRRLLETLAQRGDYARTGHSPYSDTPEWLRLGLYSAMIGWLLDEAWTCLHGPSPDRPQPIMAAAWKPGLMVCARCTHLLAFRPGSVKDRTCDGCGHVTTGPEHGDGIYANAVQLGPLTYQYGVCESCHADIPKV